MKSKRKASVKSKLEASMKSKPEASVKMSKPEASVKSKPEERRVALACAPHSGWAALVGLELDGGRPRVSAHLRMEMADPDDGEAKQPYHAVEGLAIGEARRRLARYEAEARGMAHAALERIVRELARGGLRVVGLGILESAGRKGDSLDAILASHALIHTADGDHFRDAIAAAADRCGVPVSRVRSRDLDAEAASAIGRPSPVLRETVQSLGREAGPPWTVDQKAAALLAWLVLRRGSAGAARGKRPNRRS